jgi:metal-sulfur cluster biosynthetic enzyme
MTENMTSQQENAAAGPALPTETAPATEPATEPSTRPDGRADENAAPLATTQENEDVLEALRDVVDPELGINVVDLGLVYGVTLDAERNASIDMTLTSAACPLTDVIEDQAREALEGVVSDFRINWVWLPPWGPEHITDDGREQLRALGFNL